MDGTATVGAGTTWAKADHIHPTDTSRASVASVAAAGAAAANNVGRNILHNGAFAIAQRGVGPFTTNGYTVDRWWSNGNTDTKSITQGAILDAGRAAIGEESAAFYIGNTFTGNAAAGAYTAISQPIENARRLAGKTVTVSFWAVAASGTPKLGVSIDQYFGSGGSPSAQVNGVGQSVTLSTTWTRYSLTFTIASMSGKTLGTANDHATFCNLWYSSGSTNATRSGTVGVQAATINIWGVQLEIGSVATPLEKPDPQQDLANCQRFYWTALVYVAPAADGSGTQLIYPTTMRAAPAIAGGGAGFTSGATSAVASNHGQTTGGAQTLTFSADL
jgi:hypothetical protein